MCVFFFTNFIYLLVFIQMFGRLNHHVLADELKQEVPSFWSDLLTNCFVDRPHVTVLGYPSRKDHALRAYFENERRSNQLRNLGPEGLARKNEILMNATKENEVNI